MHPTKRTLHPAATKRTLHLAVAGLLAVGLTACGGDDGADPTTPAPAPTTQAPADDRTEETTEAGGALDDTTATAEETTDDDVAGETGDSTGSENADGVPALADIWGEVRSNAEEAESLHMTFHLEDTMEGGSGTTDMDLKGQMDDSNFEANVKMEDMEASIIKADGKDYVKANEAFWVGTGAAEDPSTVQDIWVAAPEDMGVSQSFSLGQLWSEFATGLPTEGDDLSTSTAELTELDGEEVYHYLSEALGADIWITADGSNQLRKVEFMADAEAEGMNLVMEFTDWNDVEPVEAPEDATPIEELMGGGTGR